MVSAWLFVIVAVCFLILIWIISSEWMFDKRKKAILNKHKLTLSRMETIAKEKSQGFPWLADAYAEYFHLTDIELADYLEHKKRPAHKAAETLRAVASERRTAEKLYRVLKYKLEYYENLFPFLVDYGEEEIDELIKQTIEKAQKHDISSEESTDEVVIWTTHGEREVVLKRKMSKQELFQRALDRYWQKQKSNWEIGRDYERYIGYLYETKGYSVYYQGIIEGFEDLGRDLIAIKGNNIEIIQCKHWKRDSTIHERHIFQLFGTTVEYWIKNMSRLNTNQPNLFPELLRQDNIKPVFYTSAKLSEKSKEFAKVLQIHIEEEFPLKRYPCIKCNVSMRNGEKIYHLPFDQQYDRTLIKEEKRECYVETVKQAEAKGFRRAFRWHATADLELPNKG